MKYYHFIFLIIIVIYSCVSIPKKNENDDFNPKNDSKKVTNVNGQLSTLNCSKDSLNNYSIKFNKSLDSLTIISSIDLCNLFKEDLKKGSFILSSISFYIKPKEEKLKYSSYQYGVFGKNKKMLFKKLGGGLYCFIDDFEAFKKTIHYRLSMAEFKIENSTICIDSISSLHMFSKVLND